MTDFTVLVLPGAFAASVAATQAILHAAAALATHVHSPQPRWRVVSATGGAVPLSGGMHIDTAIWPARPTRPTRPTRRRHDHSTWVLPGLGVDSTEDLHQRLTTEATQQAARALRRHADAGGTVAASCAGVFVLQAAGLLQGRRATTSWWLAGELRRCEPGCRVEAGRIVVQDGPVTTAGAAFAQTDLMLHLLRQRFSPALAEAVGRVLLLDARSAQAPFVLPAMLASGHTLIARLSAQIEAALPHPPSVAELAAAFAMSPRTLARQVRAATGQSPLALVQGVRLHRARLLIETSRLSIEQVATQVGYEDATALRRLMHKATGASPSHFRAARVSAAAGGG